jgi:hypothetical protein
MHWTDSYLDALMRCRLLVQVKCKMARPSVFERGIATWLRLSLFTSMGVAILE